MSSNIQQVALGKLGRVVTGKTPSTKDLSNYGGHIPFLTPSDDMTGKYSKATARTLSQTGVETVKNCLLPKGSICMSCIGSDLGKVVIASNDLVTNQQINSIVPDNDLVDRDYLYYALLPLGKRLNVLSKTSTAVPIINKTTFQNCEIQLPARVTQERIGAFLSSIDSKIELNCQINDYLLELATARFEQELSNDSNAFKFSELVELEDSKRVPLNSRDREARKGPYPYYGATSIMDYVDDYLFDGIRVLLGEDGTVIREDGKPVLQYVWGKYWVNNHAHILKAKANYSLEAIYVALARTAINHIVTGAVQMKISQKNLNNLELEMPAANSLGYLESTFALYRSNFEESQKLEALRDLLLPKLMSGEIDVSQVDLTQLNNHLYDC